MSIGQRVVAKLIPTPDSAAGWLPDGAPLDSGTAHIIHSNLSHLSERNTRLIGHAPLQGDITATSTFTTPWAEADIDYDDTATEQYAIIPWTRPDCAWCFGPIALSHTRLGTAPAGFYPREVRVIAHGYKDNDTLGGGAPTTLRIMAVLTDACDIPLRARRLAQDFRDFSSTSTGAKIADMTLSCDTPVRPSSSWRSRPSGASAPATVTLVEAWLWVGWYTSAVSPVDRIESVSAFEVY